MAAGGPAAVLRGVQTISETAPVGAMLREWRQRRRLSQLDLACDAEISTRHLSFVETGRALPSRAMLLRLADQLAMPLRARNALLMAAGFAATYPETPFDAPALEPARRAVELILKGHEPFPALAVDHHWILVAANAAVAGLLQGVAPALLQAPVNVLRLSLHPEGLAPRIENLGEWRGHLLERLRQQIAASADPVLAGLLTELEAFPSRTSATHPRGDLAGIAVPLRLRDESGRLLSFLSTTTIFGTPVDVTLSELALECFIPADESTRTALQPSGPRTEKG
jgi:transcriptional regulator with XRE-family HTH domain